MEKERDNKKTLILSIVGILVLVIAVVGVSFAMYSFTGTGTKNNQIVTGSATLSFGEGTNVLSLTNKYPMSDAKGIEETPATFNVALTSPAYAMNAKYEVGITDIQPGATLTANYVKITVKQGENTLVNAQTISSLQSAAGDTGLLDNYVIASGTISGSANTVVKSNNYSVYAWVSSDYDLPTDLANSTDPEVDGGTLDNSTDTLHKKSTTAETFSFKLIISAVQLTA